MEVKKKLDVDANVATESAPPARARRKGSGNGPSASLRESLALSGGAISIMYSLIISTPAATVTPLHRRLKSCSSGSSGGGGTSKAQGVQHI